MNAVALPRRAVRVVLVSCLLLFGAWPTMGASQSLLGRSPNLAGTWVGDSGTLHFHFMHRFEATSPPTRKVLNTPTFLLAASLPGRTLVGAKYATNSLVAPGFPNEWEIFGRFQPLTAESGVPAELALQAGYNQAASSVDGEVTLARTIGSVRLLAAGRAFSNAYRQDETRFAAAGGAMLRVHENVSLAGDVATLLDREEAEDLAWSAGVHVQIPTTPHTLSLQASNAHTTTLQGASVGVGNTRWGFEFTIPVTLARYFGGGGSGSAAPVDAASDSPVVTMSNRLMFDPGTLRIKAGQTVTWKNTSALPHTVTADPSKAAEAESVKLPEGAEPFDSGNIPPGGEFSYTFEVVGEYVYFCIPHELAGMVGTVIVEAP